MKYFTLKDFNFSGKKVLVRVDFNVPLDEKGKKQLIALSDYYKKGDIYVTTSSKLLQYILAWKELNYTVIENYIII